MQVSKKLLVVEDDPTIRMVLGSWLRDDYDVIMAESGEEALEIAPVEKPELILLDVKMPGMDGYETCRQMQKITSLGHVKILMISATGTVSERLMAYDAGANDFITKPINAVELMAKVDVFMRLKSVEEIDKIKTVALTFLSHSARLSLNGMLAPAEMLQSDQPMGVEERKEWADLIFCSVKRLQNFFANVMTLCQMKACEWEYHYMPGDMRDIIKSVLSDFAAEISERHIQIEKKYMVCPSVEVDLMEMKRVVAILLGNAISFTPDGEVIKIELYPEKGNVCLRIADNGAGIDKDLLPKIFHEFSNIDVEKQSVNDQGISLAIARQVLHAHRGKIMAENIDGAGAAFTITLPVKSVAVPV